MNEKTLDRGRHLRWCWVGLLLSVYFVGACSLVAPLPTGPQQWDVARGPTIPHDTFPADCSLCHEGGGWHIIRADFHFDHAQETGVPLIGAHQQAECLRCHNDRGSVAAFASRGCAGCHEDVHRGQLGQRCDQCHHETDWLPQGQIAAHNRTRFPLTGAHLAVACFRCHPGAQVQNFSRAPVRCDACHQQDLQRATNPNHIANGWTHNCQQCHSPISWRGAAFSHAGVGNNCVSAICRITTPRRAPATWPPVFPPAVIPAMILTDGKTRRSITRFASPVAHTRSLAANVITRPATTASFHAHIATRMDKLKWTMNTRDDKAIHGAALPVSTVIQQVDISVDSASRR